MERKDYYSRREKPSYHIQQRGDKFSSYGKKDHQKYNIPILLLFPSNYIEHLRKFNFVMFEKIQEKTGVYRLNIDSLIKIPEPDCEIVYIFDQDQNKKLDAAKMLLDHFLTKHQRQKEKERVLKLLISEELVSLFIGKQGKSIKSLMDKCRTTVTLKREPDESNYRPAEIIGGFEDILMTVEEIDYLLEYYQKKKNMGNPHHVNDESIIKKNQIVAKLPVHKSLEDFINQEHEELNHRNRTQVSFKIEEVDDDIKNLDYHEIILILEGQLEDVCVYVANMLECFYDKFPQFEHDLQKMLIPNNYVMKLIGAKGSKIKEIAARASAAQIKILSEKKDEMNLKDCVVTINGNLKNKQEAIRIILFELEKFRHIENMHNQDFPKKYIKQDFQETYLEKRDPRDYRKGSRESLDKERGGYKVTYNFRERNHEEDFHKRHEEQPKLDDVYSGDRYYKNDNFMDKRASMKNNNGSMMEERSQKKEVQSDDQKLLSMKNQSIVRIVIPNNLIKPFVEKNKNTVKQMQKDLGCKAQIQKEEDNLLISEQSKGRVIKFIGQIDKILIFIKFFQDQLQELENNIQQL